jgi:FXSXX-COOH protein
VFGSEADVFGSGIEELSGSNRDPSAQQGDRCDWRIPMPDTRDDLGDALIDVTGLSLRDVDALDETSLAEALRRVLAEAQPAAVASFSSKI